ncbi:MAG: NAD(P)-dependent oxidoreductase [Gammaproteobacteria bacterium]|nr:NAD(P)-dependent oxidoreductase [Gammaproteobacteria bacterium]|tara:strand:+ start:2743 stop:3615 length:873 start_codon:yes stop_codon:yes gene_type:complete
MKILVIGRNGMIGNGIFEYFSNKYEVHGTLKRFARDYPIKDHINIIENIDLKKIELIEEVINDLMPNVVINCSGIIKQKSVEYSNDDHIYLNGQVPHMLLKNCQKKDIKLINFSTDCVFDGKKGSYSEEDTPNAIDVYGSSKAMGEISQDGCLTIRTSTIGLEIENKHGLIEWFLDQSGKSISGYDNAIYSGLTINELSRYLEHILINFPKLYGLYNMASEKISKYRLLSILSEKLRYCTIDIEKNTEFYCDRSLDGTLLNSKTGFKVRSWEKMLSDLALKIDERELLKN